MTKTLGKREQQLEEAARNYAVWRIRGPSANWHFFDTRIYASRERDEISALITLHSARSLADIYEVLNIGPRMKTVMDSHERTGQFEKLKDEYKTKERAAAAARKEKRLIAKLKAQK